jgi:lipopolysaccharide exporter
LHKVNHFLKNLIDNTGSLSQRAIRSGVWIYLSFGVEKLFGFLSSIILARLLLPADFGVAGMAIVATGLIAVFTEVGIQQAVIYKQDDSQSFLNTAWWLSCLRGLMMFMVTLLTAGWAAYFFKTPAVKPVIIIMGFIYILNGMNSVGLIILQRDLEFKKFSILKILSGVTGVLVGIITALLIRNYWAIIYSSLAQAVVTLIGSFLIHPFRPGRQISRPSLRFMFGYGKFLFGGSIINYLLTQGDDALVGRMLGSGNLGYYQMAYSLSNMPVSSITHVIWQVAMPVYTKKKDDIAGLREVFFQFVKITSVLAIPLAGGMLVLAQNIISVIYGEKWLPIVPSFMVLIFYGLERALNASTAPLFNAIGQPKIPFQLTAIKLILLAIIIYPLTIKYGYFGTSVASSFVSLVIFLNVLRPISRALETKGREYLKLFVTPLFATGIMISVLAILKYLQSSILNWHINDFFLLFLLIIIGVLVYFTCFYWLDRQTVHRLLNIIRNFFYINPNTPAHANDKVEDASVSPK